MLRRNRNNGFAEALQERLLNPIMHRLTKKLYSESVFRMKIRFILKSRKIAVIATSNTI